MMNTKFFSCIIKVNCEQKTVNFCLNKNHVVNCDMLSELNHGAS